MGIASVKDICYKGGMKRDGLRGRAYQEWLKEQAKRRVKIRVAYKRERSLAIVADLFGLTRGRISQIVNGEK